MKGSRWVVCFSVIVLLLVIYANAFSVYHFFINIKSQVTGNQILADNDFFVDAEEFIRGSKLVPDEEVISLSPNESVSSECVIEGASFSSSSASFGDKVKMIVEGDGCSGKKVNLTLYEDDFLFDDGIKRFKVSFVSGVATVEIEINESLSELFDEVFEGEELEIYFEAEINGSRKRSDLLIVTEDEEVLLQPIVYSNIGWGCTNAFYIDRDCDGYGNGGHDAPLDDGQPDFLPPSGPDANDFDPTINTPLTASVRYGSLNDVLDFKQWIADLNCLDINGDLFSCYTPFLGNVYFVSPTGNDLTGLTNDPGRPFRDVTFLNPHLNPGDVVIFRGGNYNYFDWEGFNFRDYQKTVKGTALQPILYIVAPGERAIFSGAYNAMVFNHGNGLNEGPQEYLIFDGLEINGKDLTNEQRRTGIAFEGDVKNLIFRNIETTRFNADIFGNVGVKLENVLFDSMVIHNSQGGQRQPEHGIYLNNPDFGEVHRDITIKDSLFYQRNRHGMQLRPPYINLKIVRNIFHSNALRGFEIKGSIQHSEISNNLFFNNGLMPILINREEIHSPTGTNPTSPSQIDDVSIFQNTIWVGNQPNGVGDSCWISQGGGCTIQNPNNDNAIGFLSDGSSITMTGLKIANNVISLTNGGALIRNEWLPNMATALIQKNFIYSTSTHPTNVALNLAGMVARCLIQPHDSTHDYTATGDGWCTSPNNIYYAWSMASFQNPLNRPLIFGNEIIPFIQLSNIFADVSPNYVYEAGRFNFNPVSSNIVTSNSLSNFNSKYDIRGNLRGAIQDSGAYEFTSSSQPAPVIILLNPSTMTNNQNIILTINGSNFDNPGAVLEFCDSTGCSSLPSNVYSIINSQRIELISGFGFGVAPGAYGFRVRNLDDQISNTISLTIQGTPPASPTALTITTPGAPNGQTQLTLNWGHDGVNVERFELRRRQQATNPAWVWTTVSNNILGNLRTFTDTGLSSGIYYEYQIRAIGGGGESGWYPPNHPYRSGTTLYTIPTSPTDLVVTPLSSTSMRLNWKDNSNNENGFNLQVRTVTPLGAWSQVGTNLAPNSVTATHTGLNPNTAYEYKLWAFNPAGSSYSNKIIGTTFTCDPNQQESCSNQIGVCAGTVRTCGINGQWGICNYTSRPNYALTETGSSLCRDGFDNDCDGRADYTGPRTASTSPDGDDGCPVGITSINAPSPVFISSSFNLDCTSSVANINSVVGTLGGVACNFVNWVESTARFTCSSSSSVSTQMASCTIDTTKSYQTGGALTTNVNVVSNQCGTYSSQSSCEAVSGNLCDWFLGCSGTKSNGFGDRCVSTGSVNSYICIRNMCGAVCDGTVNGCGQSAVCDLSSCGCTEQNPSVNGVNPSSLAWGSNNVLTVSGNYFATDAKLLVDGTAIDDLRLTRTATSLQFNYNALEFRSGDHSVTVRNPTSGRTSNAVTFTLNSNPIIASMSPNSILWDFSGSINIIGADLDTNLLEVNGIPIPFSYGLWSYENPTLTVFTFIGGILDGGNYDFVVVNRDNSRSVSSGFNNRLRVNWLFDYVMDLSPSVSQSVIQGSSFREDIIIQHGYGAFVNPEEVTLTINSPPQITASFVGGINSCIPDPVCHVYLDITAGPVLAGQSYTLRFDGSPTARNSIHSKTLTLNGVTGGLTDCTNNVKDSHETDVDCGGNVCRGIANPPYLCAEGKSCVVNEDCFENSIGGGLCYLGVCNVDNDGDRIPDEIDLCPNTNLGSTLSPLILGCPVPVHSFYPSLTTDFLSVLDLNAVEDLSIGNEFGRIQFLDEIVSVLRNYQPLDLDEAFIIENNLVGVNSLDYIEFNEPAIVTFYNLPYQNTDNPIPVIVNSGIATSCNACDVISYLDGTLVMAVPGFSNYSTRLASCGDNICSASESCSTCSLDCGTCSGGSSTTSGSSGGGSSGGGSSGGRPKPKVVLQCSDGIDNDEDGKTDYPADLGCDSLKGNNEFNIESIVTPGNNTLEDGDERVEENTETREVDIEIRVVFWTVLIIFVIGIIIIGVMIVRYYRKEARLRQIFKEGYRDDSWD